MLCVAALVISSPVFAAPPSPPARTAWLGVLRGPLSPKKARKVETTLLDALAGDPASLVVDAAGRPLDERALTPDRKAMQALLTRGVDQLLELRADKAIRALDSAIELFEGRLLTERSYDLLQDALLAKAEAQAVAKQNQTAIATMQRYIALRPSRPPTTESHDAKFVEVFERARDTIGIPGHIEVATDPPGAFVQIDGQPVGASPASSRPLPPGKHYVVARWPAFVVYRAVQLSEGKRQRVTLGRRGPAIRARDELFRLVKRRGGVDAARRNIAKIAKISGAQRVAIAAIGRTSKGTALFMVVHDADGKVIAAGRSGVSKPSTEALAKALLSRRGEFQLGDDGAPRPAAGVAKALYAGRRADGADPDISFEAGALAEAPTPAAGPTSTTTPSLHQVQPPAAEPPSRGDGLAWWVWALVGVAAAGAAAGGAVLATSGPDRTTVVLRLPGQ